MKKTLILIISILSFGLTISQNKKAELFFKDGTSIEGYAKITAKDQIKFRVSLDQKADKWTELMIESLTMYEYGIAVKYQYVSLSPDKPSILLRVLAEGKVNLFGDIKRTKTVINFGNSNDKFPTNMIYGENERARYYVQKETEKYPTPLFGIKGFRRKAKEYFSDCIGILEKLDTREFDIHNSGEMVSYYNDFCAE